MPYVAYQVLFVGAWEAIQRDCSADKLFQTDEAVELEACCVDTDAQGRGVGVTAVLEDRL